MRPRYSINNERNIPAVGIEPGSDGRWGQSLFMKFSNLKNLVLFEFGTTCIFALVVAYIIYWSANVFPDITGLDMVNSITTYSIFICQLLGLLAIGKASANFDNLVLGQLSFRSILASAIFIVSVLICAVRLWSIPTKVGQFIVLAVIVFMASLLSFRAWANESFKNKPVELQGMDNSITSKEHPEPPLTIRGWLKNMRTWPTISFLIGSNVAQVANLIKRKVGNLFPLFHDFISFKYIIQETIAQCQENRG
jgi:hypothetical protein